jgi:hypothetical protein
MWDCGTPFTIAPDEPVYAQDLRQSIKGVFRRSQQQLVEYRRTRARGETYGGDPIWVTLVNIPQNFSYAERQNLSMRIVGGN